MDNHGRPLNLLWIVGVLDKIDRGIPVKLHKTHRLYHKEYWNGQEETITPLGYKILETIRKYTPFALERDGLSYGQSTAERRAISQDDGAEC